MSSLEVIQSQIDHCLKQERTLQRAMNEWTKQRFELQRQKEAIVGIQEENEISDDLRGLNR